MRWYVFLNGSTQQNLRTFKCYNMSIKIIIWALEVECLTLKILQVVGYSPACKLQYRKIKRLIKAETDVNWKRFEKNAQRAVDPFTYGEVEKKFHTILIKYFCNKFWYNIYQGNFLTIGYEVYFFVWNQQKQVLNWSSFKISRPATE